MNIVTAIQHIQHQLLNAYDDPVLCEQYAWWLLEYVTQKTKTELLTHSTMQLSTQQQQQLTQYIQELVHDHKPIQYILGTVPFADLEILVRPPILIPRPETEEWCITLIQQLKQVRNSNITLLDLCCGSGCIALALAKALPQATVYACDISSAAVALTQENMKHNNVSNVTVIQSDLFAHIPRTVRFDLIVSNPPYIAPAEWADLDESVTAWEDRRALLADNHGLAILEAIIKQAPDYLKPNPEFAALNIPSLVLEIGYKQANAVKALLVSSGYNKVHIHKDLEGNDRVASGAIQDVATTKNRT